MLEGDSTRLDPCYWAIIAHHMKRKRSDSFPTVGKEERRRSEKRGRERESKRKEKERGERKKKNRYHRQITYLVDLSKYRNLLAERRNKRLNRTGKTQTKPLLSLQHLSYILQPAAYDKLDLLYSSTIPINLLAYRVDFHTYRTLTSPTNNLICSYALFHIEDSRYERQHLFGCPARPLLSLVINEGLSRVRAGR